MYGATFPTQSPDEEYDGYNWARKIPDRYLQVVSHLVVLMDGYGGFSDNKDELKYFWDQI